MMNSRINEILHIMHTLNRRMVAENSLVPQLFISQFNQIELPQEIFDWTSKVNQDNGIVLWENMGKISLDGILFFISK